MSPDTPNSTASMRLLIQSSKSPRFAPSDGATCVSAMFCPPQCSPMRTTIAADQTLSSAAAARRGEAWKRLGLRLSSIGASRKAVPAAVRAKDLNNHVRMLLP